MYVSQMTQKFLNVTGKIVDVIFEFLNYTRLHFAGLMLLIVFGPELHA